jgi:nucleoside-diphosphate-sugar epimerase
MLRRHRLGDLGEQGDGRCNLTYIDDLGAAALAAVERPAARGEAFNVADPEPPTWNQYLIGLGARIGGGPVGRLSARRLKLETKLLAPPLQILKLLAARAGVAAGRLPEPIPPSLLRLFNQDMWLDHRKADQVLGFARTPRDAAMAASATWFRNAHGG